MSQNPNMGNSGYGTDPQNPYGAPPPHNPYGVPPQEPYGQPSQNPYDPSQGQYGQPSQNPYDPSQGQYGQPPQNPYGPSQGQYGTPPQNPYGVPPQGPYAPPPQGGPYGAPGYAPQMQQYAPLPLNEAIQQLPNQYIKVLTKPSAATFAEELPKAGWDITWIQLLIMAVVAAVLGLIASLIATSVMRTVMPMSPNSPAAYTSFFTTSTTVAGAISNIIFIPLFFFIGMGIQYFMAKVLFKGQGTFLGQSYTALLFQVPVRIISALISVLLLLIPIAGPIIAGIIGFALGIYSIVLNVFQIQATHRLSGGKATAVVLIPYAVLIVLVLLCAVAFAGIFYEMIRRTQPQP